MNGRGHRNLYELKVLRKSFFVIPLIWARDLDLGTCQFQFNSLTIFRIERNEIFQAMFRVLNILLCNWRVPSLFINLVSFSPDVKYGSERKRGKLAKLVNNSQMTEIKGSSFVFLKLRLCLSHPSRYLLIL